MSKPRKRWGMVNWSFSRTKPEWDLPLWSYGYTYPIFVGSTYIYVRTLELSKFGWRFYISVIREGDL